MMLNFRTPGHRADQCWTSRSSMIAATLLIRPSVGFNVGVIQQFCGRNSVFHRAQVPELVGQESPVLSTGRYPVGPIEPCHVLGVGQLRSREGRS